MKIRWLYIILFLSGCTPLHIRQSIRIQSEDWALYGGSAGRTNVARTVVLPPLRMMWEYDASAGFSEYSAAAADSYLFVGNAKGEVHTINIERGKSVGVYDFGSSIVGTPVIDGDRMYVALAHDEESVVCYILPAGEIAWRAKPGDVETSPLISGAHLYVTTLKGTLVCIDKKSGVIIWTYEVPRRNRSNMIHSSPASDDSIIVFGCDNGSVYGVSIADGTLRWTAAARASIVASPSVSSGNCYVGSLDSTFYCFDIKTGMLKWKKNLGGKIYGSQAVDANYVYVGTAGGKLFCLDAQTGSMAWTASVGSVINSAPLLSGNTIYVGALDKTLRAYNAHSGDSLWQFKAEGRIKSMPVISKDYLFLLAEDKSVFAFKHSDQ